MDLLERLNNDIKSLPTLPTIFDSISQTLRDPMLTPEKLAGVIATDQASVVKVLRVANSPFYGFRGKIDTITKAVFCLGFKEVQNLIFALAVMNLFSQDKIIKGFHPKDFWRHSISVGIISRFIAAASGEKALENFFLAGVLHDIGKLIFMEFAFEEYKKVVEYAKSNNVSIKNAEFEIFGFDHTNVGKLIAEKWKLPLTFINSIHYHHVGMAGNDPDKTVACVHIADITSKLLSHGNSGDEVVQEPNPKVWELLNIPSGYFSSMRINIREDFENTIGSIFDN